MQITSQFRPLGVIGHPVSHSQSPIMMNEACQALSLPFVYLAYDIAPKELSQAVQGMKSLQFHGWNVTIPHKVSIMEYLDEIDQSARGIGAVNTVVRRDGKYIGYNTDGQGYIRSLLEEIPMSLSDQKVVILGAGGAARAVVYQLLDKGVSQIVIANRTVERAEALLKHLGASERIQVVPPTEAQELVQDATLLINTTSVGMDPHTADIPIPAAWLHKKLVVSDLIYRPRKTKLLLEAERKGCKIHNGLGMLIHQAAIAFEYWFHQAAPVTKMRRKLEEQERGSL